MKTLLYLLRHAATAANLSNPPRLQGRRHDPELAELGLRQALATRDFLAVRPIDHFYCSPLRRGVQTAELIANVHGLQPQTLDALIECDIGSWEGMDWEIIRQRDPEVYQRFRANPARQGYPGGE